MTLGFIPPLRVVIPKWVHCTQIWVSCTHWYGQIFFEECYRDIVSTWGWVQNSSENPFVVPVVPVAGSGPYQYWYGVKDSFILLLLLFKLYLSMHICQPFFHLISPKKRFAKQAYTVYGTCMCNVWTVTVSASCARY